MIVLMQVILSCLVMVDTVTPTATQAVVRYVNMQSHSVCRRTFHTYMYIIYEWIIKLAVHRRNFRCA